MRFLITALAATILTVGGAYGMMQPSHITVENQAGELLLAHAQSQKPIRLGFAGDMIFDRLVKKSIDKKGQGNYDFIFEKIQPTLSQFDFLFANVEGPVSDKGKNQGSLYSFRMDPKVIETLKAAGFKAVSVANNHIGDWGQEAITDTIERLIEANIAPVGGGRNYDEAYSSYIVRVGDTRVALLGMSQFGKGYLEASTTTSGIALIKEQELKDAIARARQAADIVVVSFHFGDEYKTEPNSFQKRMAHLAIDEGADLVVGHHPHVLEPLEVYGRGYILYSLGNFVFDQDFSKQTMESEILSVTVRVNRIERVELIPITINRDFQPELATTTAAVAH